MLGQLFAVLTALCWAQNSISYSIAGKRVTSSTVTHIRLWIALPAILIVHFLFLGSVLPEISSFLSLGFLLGSGFIGFFIADVFIFYAFVAIGPGRTLLIMTLSPILSSVFSFMFIGETLNSAQILGILITVSGVILVIFHENKISKMDSHKRKGIIFALIGTIAQASGMILAKIGIEGMHPISANLIRISAGLIGLVIFALLRHSFIEDFKKMKDRKALTLISISAVIGPVIGLILTLYAFQLAPVGIVTTLNQISPIILLPIETIFFKRKVNPGILLGTFTAVGGAVLLFLF
jgi:drug/metabolite transporter (DMT)-like permease